MSLINASQLSKAYGANDIFANISLGIPNKARIAIVGPNGVGKTTLLRILIGEEEPSSGTVSQAKKLSIGYLPQGAGLQGSHTLWEECLKALAHLREIEAELARLESAMSDPAKTEKVLARYGTLQERFERMGGYLYETRIRQTLSGLGFKQQDFHRPIDQLSGGQRTRAVLARLLLSDPDLLVLDEPTNHLDIAAVEWLEGYLSQWDGAALIVSHDRYFLDRVVDHIWEMHPEGMEIYRGNYSAYLRQRQERWEFQQKAFAAEKERMLKELDYVKRNIAGQRTQQAKGKLRRLSRQVEAFKSLGMQALEGKSWMEVKSEADVSRHTLRVDDVERLIKTLRPPSNRPPQLNLKLNARQRSGDLVLRTYNTAIGYRDEGQPLFSIPDLVLKRGECAALIGPNGAGKTTFLKTILAEMDPYSGDVRLGASLKIAYFAQAHEGLNPAHTLAEEIALSAPWLRQTEIRDFLARFSFTGDDVYKRVSALSGGEQGRLALAKLSLTEANLLLLDEPTNHLDIPSQEILQEVLATFQGTILLVSHDRYLIDALGTQIWEIEPGKRSLRVFQGSYTQYREQREREKEATENARGKNTPRKRSLSRPGPASNDRQRQARLHSVEEEISSLEEKLAALAAQLSNPQTNPQSILELGEDYVALQDEINALLDEWERLQS